MVESGEFRLLDTRAKIIEFQQEGREDRSWPLTLRTHLDDTEEPVVEMILGCVYVDVNIPGLLFAVKCQGRGMSPDEFRSIVGFNGGSLNNVRVKNIGEQHEKLLFRLGTAERVVSCVAFDAAMDELRELWSEVPEAQEQPPAQRRRPRRHRRKKKPAGLDHS